MSIRWSALKITKPEKNVSISGRFRLALVLALFLLGCHLTFAQSGSLDTSFDPGDGANTAVMSIAIQSDGKIVIGGSFTSFDGIERNRIARLNEDGSLDITFATGSGANDQIRSIIVLNDGKIIVGGYFTSYDGVPRNRIARLNDDGSLDTSFDPGVGANDWILNASLQSDGKIIIAGFFTNYNGVARNYITRLNADGSLDTSFDTGTGPNLRVSSVAIQNDGKIIIGGYFTSYNGTARNLIARLNANGSLDTSFDPGSGPAYIFESISLQSDGKIIIGGYFNSYAGIDSRRIARLNTDGSLDASFNLGSGVIGYLWTTTIQDDDKILIGGKFTSYDGTARRSIARLNADGSLDTSFDPGTGADDHVASIVVQNDSRIIIGGAFTTFDGTEMNHIARLNSLSTGIDHLGNADGKIKIFPNPCFGAATIQSESELKNATLTIINSSGQAVRQIANVSGHTITLNCDELPGGLYFVRLLIENEVILTEKLVVSE